MAAKYFICRMPQINDSHSVHKKGCPYMPEPRNRIFLGIFKSPHEAIEQGRKYFCIPGCCRFCSKEYYKENSKDSISEVAGTLNLLTSDRLRDTWESALVCSKN